jgi:hypothetical protein
MAVTAAGIRADLRRVKSSATVLADEIRRENKLFQAFALNAAKAFKSVSSKLFIVKPSVPVAFSGKQLSNDKVFQKIQHLYQDLKSLKRSHEELRSSMAPLTFELNVQLNEDISALVEFLRIDSRHYVAMLEDRFHLFKKEYRARIKDKYRTKAEALLQTFTKEREEILAVVKFECSEILSDAKALISSHPNSARVKISTSLANQDPLKSSSLHVWSSVLDSGDSGDSFRLQQQNKLASSPPPTSSAHPRLGGRKQGAAHKQGSHK